MNEKVHPTASNKRKKELAKEGDLVAYKRKRKTIDPSTVVPPNTVNSANEGVSEVLPPTESAEDVNILQGSEFETESAQAAIVEVFEDNLLQDLNAFKSLKAGSVGNLLSLKKLKEHYAYKLEKVLSDGTAATTKKMKGLTARSVARAYMMYALGSFLFPMKKGTNVSALYLVLLAKDKVAKKWSWGSAVLAHMYYNLGAASRDDGRQFACCTTLLGDVSVTDRYGSTALINLREALDNYKLEDVVWDPYRDKRDSPHTFKEVTFFYGALASPYYVQPYYPNRVVRQFNREQGIPTKRLLTKVSNLWNAKEPRKFNPKYEWVDCFSSQKLKEFVLKKADRGEDDDIGIHQRKPTSVNEHGNTLVHQSEDIVEQYDASTSKCDLLKETIEQMKVEIELKRVVDKKCALKFADLLKQLDVKILECKNLEEKDISLEAELRQKSSLEDCNQSLPAELNKSSKEIESLKAVNAILMEQIDMQLPPATPLTVLQSHQPVPDTILAKKYEDLLAAQKDVKKKLITKEDFVSHSK
ncbi:hypothetical protein GIB67_014229 [Kingdonia uniflora]|uniref:Aminotransferase-like plant mobile domain-containing protein n=1 Tax=Kingdonia uniflora TaxID=39325 RepID=A0A7J7M239_9MAGN|nr:hypothetical protein GIB67_014229 [Kingdonia uniflora]